MFRTTDRYLLKQISKTTVYSVVALSLFLVMGQIFQEIRPLIVEKRVPLPLVGKFILNVFPMSLMFTIPWGFMAATLLVFGRLSQEQELNAMQLAGQSLPRIALPVFVFGGILSALCLWVNVKIVPVANARTDNIVYEAVERDPKSLIKPGMITSQLNNLRIFVQSKENEKLHSLHLYRLPDPKKSGNLGEYVYAEDATLGVDPEKKQIKLTLTSAYIESKASSGELNIYVASAAPWKVDLTRKKKYSASSMTESEIMELLANPPDPLNAQQVNRYLSSITQRYSFAMASLAFAFIAVPLSLTKRRNDSTSGILIALLLGAGYFIFSLVAQKSNDPSFAKILLWSPNVLCVLCGIILFRRVRFL
ncbi:MAG: LptF/LptG family permease [Akkermansiaceae bacterium]|jgi:lipopolysaccharide export system permease protein